ncbi:hypothetical protein BG52_09860 [Paenibacillus darwinianus]|nr:hypothetical protein BG52_09860 [Paenibacillus darwinianus]
MTAAGRQDDIVVFDIGRKLGGMSAVLEGRKPLWDRPVYRSLHKGIRAAGQGWVPAKSFMGDTARSYSSHPIYRSDMYGGLSKLWGASFLPFTAEDLADWPISGPELAPYYDKLLSRIRVTGADDALSGYFGGTAYNERALDRPEVFRRLEQAINARSGETSFIAGNPRLAVANSGPDGCTYCGHCFYGCYNRSIYSADMTIGALEAEGKLRYVPGKRMLRFKRLASGRVEIDWEEPESAGSKRGTDVFDRIYVAAGCIESTRIVSASLGVATFPIRENPMYQVPIVYTGGVRAEDFGRHIALINVLAGRLPGAGIERYAHIQIYPINVYLWNHALSKAFGSTGLRLSGLAQRTAGKHVYMMLFYLHGDYSKDSSLTFGDGGERLSFVYRDGTQEQMRLLVDGFAQALKGTGFHVLRHFVEPLAPGGSYHYGGTMPMGRSGLIRDSGCSVTDGIYVTDSAVFPSIPAQNHSFTIMANAYRVAERSLAL